MAAALGAFSFLTMNPRPQGAQEGIVLESRAGAAGHAAWKTGSRGESITVETVVDVSTYAAAVTLCGQYEAAAGSLLACTMGGNAVGTYLVTRVNATPEAIVLGVGGIAGQSYAMVRATWHLVAWV